ncbi:hypothetical protein L2748_23910, partial [Shewanella sairae]|nr:hypothetical protein [Shewanella sairae]
HHLDRRFIRKMEWVQQFGKKTTYFPIPSPTTEQPVSIATEPAKKRASYISAVPPETGITAAINAMMGGGKQVVNDLIASQGAAQAEWFADKGIISVTDNQTGQQLSTDEISERYRNIETFDIAASEQSGADVVEQIPAYSGVLLAVELASTRFKKLLTDPAGLAQEVQQSIEQALKDARSAPEALGHFGGNYATKRLGLEPDKDFVNRYHGPDDMLTSPNGNRVEAEFKGYNKDSTVLSSNTKLQKQGSEDKNLTRARNMVNKKKQGKVGKDSNRQGGAYLESEIRLWEDIFEREGRKDHLAVFTNTESGNVKAFWQDRDGNLMDKALDEPIPHFNDAKDIIEKINFKGKSKP